MEENNQEQINVNQNLNEQPRFTPLGQVNEPMPKKKKSKLGVVIVLLVLLAAIIGGLAYYYFQIYTNPKVVYQQMIKKAADACTLSEPMPEEISTVKAKIKADVDLKIDEEYLEEGVEEILDIVNEIEAAVDLQMDINQEKMLLGVDSDYQGEKLIKLEALIDAKNEEGYLKLEPITNDVVDMESAEIDYESLQEGFDEVKEALEEVLKGANSIFVDEKAQKKAMRIFSDECAKIIKKEYVSKDKEKISVNGKDVNADKYVLKMTYEQMVNEFVTIYENLNKNEEFLNCWSDSKQIKSEFESMINSLKTEKFDETESTIAVNLYRTGLKQEFIRVDFVSESNGEKVTLRIEKQGEVYAYKAIMLGQEMFSGTVKVEKADEEITKLGLTLKIEKMMELALNVEVAASINGEFKGFDTKNAINPEEISEDEKQEIKENLENSKLYELIEEISEITGSAFMESLLEENPDLDDGKVQLPNEEEEEPSQTDNNPTQEPNEENSNVTGVVVPSGDLVVFTKNNKNVAVDMDFEVEFYDENGMIVGSSINYLTAVGAGREVVVEMSNTPKNFSTYKIYVDETESEEIEYFDEIKVVHNNNGEEIVVQVKNNSQDEIKYMTVMAVYYNQGKVVGIDEDMASEIAKGRSGNFTLDYPYDTEYNDVQFDEYKVYVTEAYSYNW